MSYKICKKCQGYIKNEEGDNESLWTDCKDSFAVVSDNVLVVGRPTGIFKTCNIEVAIKYCPECGRKLI